MKPDAALATLPGGAVQLPGEKVSWRGVDSREELHRLSEHSAPSYGACSACSGDSRGRGRPASQPVAVVDPKVNAVLPPGHLDDGRWQRGRAERIDSWFNDHDNVAVAIAVPGMLAAFVGMITTVVGLFASATTAIVGASALAYGAVAVGTVAVPELITSRRRAQRMRAVETADTLEGDSTAAILARRVVRLTREIKAEPGWQSELLDSHRIRLDLDEERDQTLIQLSRTQRLASRILSQHERLVGNATATATLDVQLAAVRESLVATTARVAALADYGAHIATLSVRITELAALTEAEGNDELLADVLAGASMAGFATDNLRTLTAEAQSLSAGIADVIELVRSDHTALTAATVR